jgi:predicted nucleotidyltransferase component of viral defense system
MDIGASILAKLKNKSQTSGMPYQVHLRLFCQEEFLRRLSLSKYVDNLILKGGLFIFTLSGFESRATIDIDFLLKQIPSSINTLQRIITEIINTSSGNDFIIFEISGIEEISPQRKYKGASFKLVGKIKNTKTPFAIDFGIGDIIVPKAEKRKIPTQLDSFVSPEISTYSLESTIAEKFDAMLERMELTSRMKDYYDIYYIAQTFDFDGRKLQEAIMQTLETRGTSYDHNSLHEIINFSNNEIMLIMWQQFIRRTKLPNISFSEVITLLNRFLNDIWNAIINGEEWFKNWRCSDLSWHNKN